MPNVMGVLRAEIRRLARKETRDAVRDLKRQVAALRRRLAATKKRMVEVERTTLRAGAGRGVLKARRQPNDDGATQIRFSPRWVRVHRGKLGMSRRVYAKLVGVSPQTILLWEAGKARPRRSALAAWREIRGKGVRELRASLGSESLGRSRRGRPPAGAGRRRKAAAKPRGRRAASARGAKLAPTRAKRSVARRGRMARAARKMRRKKK